MYNRTDTWTCDDCGITEQKKHKSPGVMMKPDGWVSRNSQDLCHSCSKKYIQYFKIQFTYGRDGSSCGHWYSYETVMEEAIRKFHRRSDGPYKILNVYKVIEEKMKWEDDQNSTHTENPMH